MFNNSPVIHSFEIGICKKRKKIQVSKEKKQNDSEQTVIWKWMVLSTQSLCIKFNFMENKKKPSQNERKIKRKKNRFSTYILIYINRKQYILLLYLLLYSSAVASLSFNKHILHSKQQNFRSFVRSFVLSFFSQSH